MARISMTGRGGVDETADFLKEHFRRGCALAEENRRTRGGAGTAFLLFENSGLLARGVKILALDISGDGKNVTVDAFGHACGSIWADEDELPLAAAEALRGRGFAALERESWKISSPYVDDNGVKRQVEYVSPEELAKLGSSRSGDDARAANERASGTEKTRKRSYDPEVKQRKRR